MEFVVNCGLLAQQNSACAVVGIFESRELSASAKALDQQSGGYLSHILEQGDCDGKLGQTLLLHAVPKIAAKRVLLVGLGSKKNFADTQYRQALTTTVQCLLNLNAADVLLLLTELPVKSREMAWKVRQAVEVYSDISYRFTLYKSQPDAHPRALQQMCFLVEKQAEVAPLETAITDSKAVVMAMNTVKNLANTPPNVCTPRCLAQHAIDLSQKYSSITTEVLTEKEIIELGMGALWAVGQGSSEPPRLITLNYQGTDKTQAPIALVGKGITFDTGGLSLKPAANMVGMKFDMCGAATVLAIVEAIAHYKWPINVVGVVAAAENMPSNRAARPDDIVTTLSGQTVEITNTDAEGRLVLCDALTYSERFHPSAVIDIATLTGGIIIALGNLASGLFSNDDSLTQELLAAGTHSGDRVWHMPVWEEYQKLLDSPVADFINATNQKDASSIVGACFLARFAKKFRWAHLDVAGTANRMGKDAGATGRPVPLLMHYLRTHCSEKG
jgi:leucyl aminopeptidase